MFKRRLFKQLRRDKFNEYLFKDNVMMVHKLTANLTNNADRMEERMNERKSENYQNRSSGINGR